MDVTAIVQTVVPTAGLIVIAWMGKRKIDEVREPLAAVHEKVAAIDRAVNGKKPGESTISENVDTILAKQEKDQPSDGDDEALVTRAKKILEILEGRETQPAAPRKPRTR